MSFLVFPLCHCCGIFAFTTGNDNGLTIQRRVSYILVYAFMASYNENGSSSRYHYARTYELESASAVLEGSQNVSL